MTKPTLDMFADFAIPADLVARCFILHPATKARLKCLDGSTECYIDVHGWHSNAAQEFRFEREERLRRMGREMTGEESYDDLGDLVARLCVGWNLITPTGKVLDIECTRENSKKLMNSLDHRWIRQQVIEFLNLEGNFLPPTWIN